MTRKQAVMLAKKFGGWFEGDTAYFPSVAKCRQFEAAAAQVPA